MSLTILFSVSLTQTSPLVIYGVPGIPVVPPFAVTDICTVNVDSFWPLGFSSISVPVVCYDFLFIYHFVFVTSFCISTCQPAFSSIPASSTASVSSTGCFFISLSPRPNRPGFPYPRQCLTDSHHSSSLTLLGKLSRWMSRLLSMFVDSGTSVLQTFLPRHLLPSFDPHFSASTCFRKFSHSWQICRLALALSTFPLLIVPGILDVLDVHSLHESMMSLGLSPALLLSLNVVFDAFRTLLSSNTFTSLTSSGSLAPRFSVSRAHSMSPTFQAFLTLPLSVSPYCIGYILLRFFSSLPDQPTLLRNCSPKPLATLEMKSRHPPQCNPLLKSPFSNIAEQFVVR